MALEMCGLAPASLDVLLLMVELRRSKKSDEYNPKPEGDTDNEAIDTGKIETKKPYAQQRPANTALRQQRLKAWHPILTHSTVLPLLFGLGVFFAVLGAVMYWSALQVNELTIQYSTCRDEAPQNNLAPIPSKYVSYRFHSSNKSMYENPPQWSKTPVPPGPGREDNPARFNCTLYFTIPAQMDSSVFLYYKLTNFYQNHRRYMKSIDSEQLLSKPRTADQLQDAECKPLGKDPVSGLSVYPCGLIANSVFNDTFQSPVLLDQNNQPQSTYEMSENNIIWSGEAKRYRTPTYSANDVVPPPFWQGAEGPFGYPSGRYEEGKLFDPSRNEHFQVWMRTAAFPTFRKLYMRNDTAPMQAGRYSLLVGDNYPVNMYGGTKSIVISTASWIGGRSFMIGLSHIAVAALCFALGILLTAKQIIKPRRVGDTSFLSWNKPHKQH